MNVGYLEVLNPLPFQGSSLSTKLTPLQVEKSELGTAPRRPEYATRGAESILRRASEQSQLFQFSKAARTYSSYLRIIPSADPAQRGDALLKIGFLDYAAAMQSNDPGGFKARIGDALSTTRTAERCFKKMGKLASPDFHRSRAFAAYLEFWMAKDPKRKARLLEDSWSLAKKSLNEFERTRRYQDYSETYEQLSVGLGIGLEYDWQLASRIRKCTEAVERGKKSVSILRSSRKKDELVRAMVRTALFLDALSEITLESSKAPRFQQEALELWKEAQTISKHIAYSETSRPPQGFHRILDQNQSLSLYRETLKIVAPRKDKFAISWLTEKLAKWSFYAAEAVENPALRVKGHIEALHYAEEAAKNFELINLTSAGGGVLWVHSPYAEHFHQLATYESDPNRRRALQEKSLRSTPELLRLAKQSGHPQVVSYAFHIASKAAVTLADFETNKKRKIRLLRDGLKHRIEAVRVTEKIEPIPSWNRGIMMRYLAEIQAKLGDLAEQPEDQRELLEKATLTQENGLKLSTDYVQSLERTESHVFRGPIGRYHFERASTLQRLNSITGDRQYLRKAAQEYTEAADWFQRAERPSGAAECYWKAAEAYDVLQVHSLASENFVLAAEAYETLGKKIPPLKDLSHDYTRYLRAWSKIELARSLHQGLGYGSAAKAYDQVARLHATTKRWRFLSPYYRAWSHLESGENLSRTGQRRRAVEAFQRAADLFAQSRVLLKDLVARLDQPDEEKMVAALVRTPKNDYARARVTLEEAMMAESGEDYQTSFEKFGLASERLREISEHSESEQDRVETGFLSTLCNAWQLSSKAELEGSTEILHQASKIFQRATKTSPSQNSMKLAQGHEEFCKALIASRRFANTLKPEFHKEAGRRFDLASNFYLGSGFKTASDHALGRKLLVDAFDHLTTANNEEDPKKRASLYIATISLLRESASAFRKAHQPKKREQAKELLKKAKTESRIAKHLTGILDAALETSTNVAFQPASHGYERPVGLDRFDHPDIEVRLTNLTKASRSGMEIELQLEITNTGKQRIGLVRLDEAIPASAQLGAPLKDWKLEGGSIIPLQSRLINVLQTETIQMVLRANGEGLLRISPKVIFTDASGLEHKRTLQSKVLATSRILEFLANSFIKDYATRRLAEPNCGWRTLMEVVHDLKIPRSHVYGEPRYGRTFGRQLDSLVKSSMVEYRIFPGGRGRGGDITRVRVQLTNADVRSYLEELMPGLGPYDPLSGKILASSSAKIEAPIIASA